MNLTIFCWYKVTVQKLVMSKGNQTMGPLNWYPLMHKHWYAKGLVYWPWERTCAATIKNIKTVTISLKKSRLLQEKSLKIVKENLYNRLKKSMTEKRLALCCQLFSSCFVKVAHIQVATTKVSEYCILLYVLYIITWKFEFELNNPNIC